MILNLSVWFPMEEEKDSLDVPHIKCDLKLSDSEVKSHYGWASGKVWTDRFLK